MFSLKVTARTIKLFLFKGQNSVTPKLGVNADPHIHIIGGNGVTMRLLTRSALYCRLIADPYNLINGSS